MRLGIFFFFIQYILYIEYGLSNAKPMVGSVRRAVEGEYSFSVSIKLNNEEDTEPEVRHGSTGVLVSNRHVLTVEHGVRKVALKKLEVIIGSFDIRQGVKYNISRVTTYNDWAQENRVNRFHLDNDLAILRLIGIVPDAIKPAVLSSLSENSLTGKEAIIASWGLGENNKVSRYMHCGTVKVMTKEDCKERIHSLLGKFTNLHERHLCTSADPAVMLRAGDSGGPLVLPNGEVIGINRASCPPPENNLHPLKINFHIGIHAYRYFIQHVIDY